mmetsp:Transcript_3296/g.4824  ORF Transcript_3296/g.4824 Transcript_3296/m.4824 type:complete len:92 (+) Transcript_3296:896-1171(+)
MHRCSEKHLLFGGAQVKTDDHDWVFQGSCDKWLDFKGYRGKGSKPRQNLCRLVASSNLIQNSYSPMLRSLSNTYWVEAYISSRLMSKTAKV